MRYLTSPHHQAAAAALLVAVLMLLPGRAVPPVPAFDWADKVAHLLIFLAMTLLVIRSFRTTSRVERPVLAAALVTLVYAVLLELAQGMIPGRFLEPADIAANSLGVVLALPLQSLIDRS
jgi:VanZ family protein